MITSSGTFYLKNLPDNYFHFEEDDVLFMENKVEIEKAISIGFPRGHPRLLRTQYHIHDESAENKIEDYEYQLSTKIGGPP